MIKLFSSNIFGFLKNPKFSSAIVGYFFDFSRSNLWLLIISWLQSDRTSTHTNCLIQLLKSGGLILSSQPRRAFYSSASYCQAVISTKFQSFPCYFNHLRFDQLHVARQREANSTAFQRAVNCLFSPLPITAIEASSSLTNLLTHWLPRSFRFICSGRGANYRPMKSYVKA